MAEFKKHKKYNGLTDMFNLQICPVCGNDYIIQDSKIWTYQKQVGKRHLNFCSWGCYRKFMAEHDAQKEENFRQGRLKQVAAARAKKEEKNGMA